MNKDLKDQIRSNLKKRSGLINDFIESNKPNSVILWAIYSLDCKIDNDLKKLHVNLGGSNKTPLDK